MGLDTVLAASQADLDSMAARMADRTLCIGPARSADSYLNIPAVVHAALGAGADAVHPGYGFLSERAAFARCCEDAGLIFIGPTSAQIEQVGDKLAARRLAEAADVAVVPGGQVSSKAEALALAGRVGYPILIKAVGGGGGRGLKRADGPEQLDALYELASAEALAAFGDPRVYVECFVTHGRHIEVQVMGDGQRLVHLGDRDCSIQRRYQKLIEEAPAPALSAELRREIHAAAVRFAARIGYLSLGTVEFLVDVPRQRFYFLEMNARIQVEHPVTEAITGLDLVEEQLHIAQGEPLRWRQSDLRFRGHAIECRINAEDPAAGFRPSPGKVTLARFPEGPGLRVDTHMMCGASVPPFYDSMVAKIIAHADTREAALARLGAALAATRLEGIHTNLSLHRAVLTDPAFAAAGVDTHFLTRFLAQTPAVAESC
jgi:acetyl-CoA carboxylase biotin carboxylase subunit